MSADGVSPRGSPAQRRGRLFGQFRSNNLSLSLDLVEQIDGVLPTSASAFTVGDHDADAASPCWIVS